MANRYQSDDRSRRSQRGYGRQAEQFQSDFDDERRSQMGESWRDDDYASQQAGWQSDDRSERERRSGPDYRAAASEYGNERFGTAGYGPARYTPGGGRNFSNFTGNDYGGADFSGGAASYGAGSWLGANHGEWRDRNLGRSPRDQYARGSRSDRGFFERAGDEIASWFGDEDATRRREQDHRGHGPVGYERTDERIREDASERLTEDWAVDARKIVIAVSSGEITLDGTVPSRDQKRRAEDLVEDLSGVKHVQNNLRVDEGSTWDRNNSGASKTTSST